MTSKTGKKAGPVSQSPSLHPSVFPSFRHSVFPSFRLSVPPSLHPSIPQSFRPSVIPSTHHPATVLNHCFEVELTGDQLICDYQLKPGISQKLNASYLMRKMGII